VLFSDEPDGLRSELEFYTQGDVIGSISQGDFITATGIIEGDVNNDKTTELKIRILNVDSLKTRGVYDISEKYYPYEPDLVDFITRSQYILATQGDLDETNVKTKIITPFLSLLGWNIYSDEVELECAVDMGSGSKRVDYVLKDSGRVKVCVEAKGSRHPVRENHQSQVTSYMRQTGANWGLLSTGYHYQLFKSVGDDVPEEELVVDCKLDGVANEIQKFEGISKNDVSELGIGSTIETRIISENDEVIDVETIEYIPPSESKECRARIKHIVKEVEHERTGKSWVSDIESVAREEMYISAGQVEMILEELCEEGELERVSDGYYSVNL